MGASKKFSIINSSTFTKIHQNKPKKCLTICQTFPLKYESTCCVCKFLVLLRLRLMGAPGRKHEHLFISGSPFLLLKFILHMHTLSNRSQALCPGDKTPEYGRVLLYCLLMVFKTVSKRYNAMLPKVMMSWWIDTLFICIGGQINAILFYSNDLVIFNPNRNLNLSLHRFYPFVWAYKSVVSAE